MTDDLASTLSLPGSLTLDETRGLIADMVDLMGDEDPQVAGVLQSVLLLLKLVRCDCQSPGEPDAVSSSAHVIAFPAADQR